MKTALKVAFLSLFSLAAQAQTRMWVNTNAANLRDKPAPTAHVMLKLGAPAEVTVMDNPKEYKQNPALKGKWVQVMFTPYANSEGSMSWAGWMDARSLVANRDSVKVPTSAALFSVPKDEKVFPRTSGVKGVPGYHRSYQVR